MTPDTASNLISNRLFDKIYEKFNIEEEDLMKSIQNPSNNKPIVIKLDIGSDVDILALFKDIRDQILDRLPKPPMMGEPQE